MKFLALMVVLILASALRASADISSLISQDMFNEMLKHRNDGNCPGKGFYTYDAFIAAANSFGAFGTTGDDTTRKREIAAFLAQTSHETTGSFLSLKINIFCSFSLYKTSHACMVNGIILV